MQNDLAQLLSVEPEIQLLVAKHMELRDVAMNHHRYNNALHVGYPETSLSVEDVEYMIFTSQPVQLLIKSMKYRLMKYESLRNSQVQEIQKLKSVIFRCGNFKASDICAKGYRISEI
ncbi:hypothetical protein PR048_002321 [Dryococelus australis]|uniref:Uncharacterized protein n=1 Tax=Dryococelus australis TaxID=614101 RepID=A0ABQ9IJU2_9NEOP|nr:hypothetical protein PR048_002321 [Dryococelus australis]